MAKLDELLQTKNKAEQGRIVEQLIQQANSEIVGMTILVNAGGRISLSVIGQPEPELLIQTLEVVKTDLIKSQVKQEMEQLAGEDIQDLEQS